jgi:hypothetical protein
MTILRTGIVALLVLGAVPAAAQGPAGKWKASINTPSGPFPLVLEFLVDRGKVTGTVSNDFLPRIPIEEGAVKGSELSFKLRLQTVTLGYSGSVAGNKLTLKTKVLEERPSAGQTLGGVLKGVDVITATRDK